MLPLQPAAQVRPAEDPDLATRAAARLAAPAGADWAALRLELRSAHAAAERRLGRLHPRPTTLRALAGLVLDRQGDPRGLRLFAEACGDLHRQLRLVRRSRGGEHPATLPFLEALAELYRLEKLEDGRWEDQALRVHLAQGGGPRPDLERRVVAALERHYGPFLSFRAPDREAVLEDVARLVALWRRRPSAAERTAVFIQAALRSDARGVWKLAAGHAQEPLREALRGLLGGLDPQPLQADLGPFLAWLPAQAGTPWEAAARALGGAVEDAVARAPLAPAQALRRRMRLALALGEPARAVAMVAEALPQAREDRPALLALAEELVRGTEEPTLFQDLQRALRADLASRSEEPASLGLRLAVARRLEDAGDAAAAEPLWRSLLGSGPGTGGDLSAEVLEHALGRNLAQQQRWEEARFFLEPLSEAGKWQADPALHFLLARIEAGRRDFDSARRWAREGLARLPEPPAPLPGLAAALRLLRADPEAEALLARLRGLLDPAGTIPALDDPERLLDLLERLEADRARPQPVPGSACRSPWAGIGEDAASRGQALLQAAAGLRLADAEPCLREALRQLERAWGDQDPRLLPALLRLAQCLQDQEHADAEYVLRRALALAAAQPERDLRLEAEVRARLGQVLAERGRAEEADALLQSALGELARDPATDAKALELFGGVLLMRLARLEHQEDYPGALEALQVADRKLARLDPSSPVEGEAILKEMGLTRSRLERQAALQALLRAQGLE